MLDVKYASEIVVYLNFNVMECSWLMWVFFVEILLNY